MVDELLSSHQVDWEGGIRLSGRGEIRTVGMQGGLEVQGDGVNRLTRRGGIRSTRWGDQESRDARKWGKYRTNLL